MTNEELQQLEIIDEKKLEDMIYVIRGQKVMLDFELAKLYGYETKAFNQQVQRNINKFPPDFRFQLTWEEMNNYISWSKKSTLNEHYDKRGTNIKYLPYAFTEQGIYMLMTVLKGEIATEQSIRIIRVFKTMKDIITESSNSYSIGEVLKLANKVNENSNEIKELKEDNKAIHDQLEAVMDYFIDPNKYKPFIIKNGQRIEADIAYAEIYKNAKRSIIIVDDYIDIRTLSHLKSCSKDIDITIYSDNLAKDKIDMGHINDFMIDTGINIKLLPTNKMFHDRYIITDYKLDSEIFYLCGPSEKDAGDKVATIIEIVDKYKYHPIIDELVN